MPTNPLMNSIVWLHLALAVALMLTLWSLSGRRHHAARIAIARVGIAPISVAWVDVAWSALLGLQAFSYALHWFTTASPAQRMDHASSVIWAGSLPILWSLRLSVYLGRRVQGEAEDGRYRALRLHWGEHAPQRFLLLFLIQAGLAWLFGLVFYPLILQAGIHTPGTGFYVAWWLGVLAIIAESVADRQLARHRQDQPGITCRSGLWRYSRHPNYFFEWLHWWAYPLMLWGLGWNSAEPAAWLVILAPWLMLLFLYRLSGIPFNEQQALQSRGEDYRRYQRETAAFIPWRPRPNRD